MPCAPIVFGLDPFQSQSVSQGANSPGILVARPIQSFGQSAKPIKPLGQIIGSQGGGGGGGGRAEGLTLTSMEMGQLGRAHHGSGVRSRVAPGQQLPVLSPKIRQISLNLIDLRVARHHRKEAIRHLCRPSPSFHYRRHTSLNRQERGLCIRLKRKRVDAAHKILSKRRVNRTVPLYPAHRSERIRCDLDPEMAFSPGAETRVTPVFLTFVDDLQPVRLKR